MGDCGSLRCVQEKRHFKKELASWYKKIPFTIGLELVSENIAGSASGHIKTLLLPFNDMEIDEPEDFLAFKDSTCIYCQGKPAIESSEQENIPEDLSGAEQITPDRILKSGPEQLFSSAMKEPLDSTPGMVATNSQLPVLEGLNSFYNQLAMTSMMYQQQQLQNAAVQAALTAGASSSQHQPTLSAAGLHPPTKDLALDLRGEECEVSHPLALTPESGSLKVPEIRNKKKKDNQLKRTYTDRELNAAVEAIKSGSVGTRRAAQMYGVPRSTLRNKVFKSAEMSRQLPYNRDDFTEAPEVLDENCPSPNKSNSESETSSPRSKETSPKGKTSLESKIDMSHHNSAVMKQLEELQAKQGISDQINMMSQQNRLLGDLFNPLNFAPSSYPFFMPQYSTLSAVPGFDYINPYTSSMLLPYLPEMMKSFAQKQIEMERLSQNSAYRHNNSSRKIETNTRQAKKDDIRVPAYKPSTSHMVSEHDMASKVAKSMIKRESADRFPELSRAYSANEYTQNISHSPSTSKRSPPLDSHSPRKKSLAEQAASQVQPSHSITNGGSTGKKRPKRGQYRKYDSERLADAVKAVQRGEMSVHRAGTHYGVPHSTLEYKVKERHLLRKKKIAENGENKLNSVAAVSNKTAMTNVSLESNQSTQKISQPSPPQSITESRAANEDNKHTFMDFSPSPFPMDAPASELLLKLQARAQRQQAVSQNSESLGSLA